MRERTLEPEGLWRILARVQPNFGGVSRQEMKTLLGHGSVFDGKLTFEGTMRIDGRFAGEILSGGCLIVGVKAELRADIKMATLIVQGTVLGAVSVSNFVHLEATARVHGDLDTPQIVIEQGAVFDGHCRMGRRAPPSPR